MSRLPLLFRRSPSSFRSSQALRGCRARARELGILDEFWELFAAGDVNAAVGRVTLEEQRLQRRRTRQTSVLLACSLSSGLLWLAARIWSG